MRKKDLPCSTLCCADGHLRGRWRYGLLSTCYGVMTPGRMIKDRSASRRGSGNTSCDKGAHKQTVSVRALGHAWSRLRRVPDLHARGLAGRALRPLRRAGATGAQDGSALV